MAVVCKYPIRGLTGDESSVTLSIVMAATADRVRRDSLNRNPA